MRPPQDRETLSADVAAVEAARAAYDCPRELMLHAGDAEAMISVSAAGRVLAFRGTTLDGWDILQDLRALPWPSRFGFVHRGFLRQHELMWPKIRTAVLEDPGNLIVTGHSKGGAEAALMAARMCLEGWPPAALVTFGSPRVDFGGVGAVLKAARVPVRRYVYGCDAVARVPGLLWLGLGRHVAEATQLGFIPKGGCPHSIVDHRIRNYDRALSNLYAAARD